jgi:hypothetical protein
MVQSYAATALLRVQKFQCCRQRCFSRQGIEKRTVRHAAGTIIQVRGMAVYAFGQGWTGALGTGKFDQHLKGHDDEEDPDMPTLLYDGDVLSAAAGWGHSVLVTNEFISQGTQGHFDQRLLVTGRPHDFQALLRLYRFPPFLRNYAVQFTYSYKQDYEQQRMSMNPTALASRFINWALNERAHADETLRLWEIARELSILSELQEVELPNYDAPGTVVASAGLTAVLGQAGGTLYTFGLNNRGQCGVGDLSNNVWVPQQVMGLSEDYAAHGREYLYQAFPIRQVALGLQHGYALCSQGNLYSWGKGERAQLGQDAAIAGVGTITSSSSSDDSDGSLSGFARQIRRAFVLDGEERPDFFFFPRVVQVASGFHHGAALTDTNQVFVWGKNVLPPLAPDKKRRKLASDSKAPTPLKGLPNNLQVVRIACGSHHTSILMEDGSVYAVGICTDKSDEIVFDPICVVPPGIIDLPCRQFDAHFDRTTIVGKDGTQILQFHLWHDPELREYSIFTPFWADLLLEENLRIRSVHRGWLHSLVVTDEDDLLEQDQEGRRKMVADRKSFELLMQKD